MEYKLTIKVIDIRKEGGKCNFHQVGDTIIMADKEMDTSKTLKNGLCPAATAAIYPYLLGFKYGAEYTWTDNPHRIVACCSDPIDLATFEITREPLNKSG